LGMRRWLGLFGSESDRVEVGCQNQESIATSVGFPIRKKKNLVEPLVERLF